MKFSKNYIYLPLRSLVKITYTFLSESNSQVSSFMNQTLKYLYTLCIHTQALLDGKGFYVVHEVTFHVHH